MLHRLDHYASLTRAVARLDRDSYEARGAIYDRAQNALVRRLSAADPPYSQADFDMELLAFRYAVRRIECGDDGAEADGDHEIGSPQIGHPKPPLIPSAAVSAQARSGPLEPEKVRPARRSIAGRVTRQATFAAGVLGIGMAGYAVMTGELVLPGLTGPWLTEAGLTEPGLPERLGESSPLAGRDDAVAQQGVVYDDPPNDPNAVKAVGKVFWRTRTEPAGAQGERVVQLDLQVPQRRLAMAMTMRRAPPGDAMSHLIEIRFLREDGQPDADIANIGVLSMTTAEHARRVALTAQVVRVTPGVFLVGLSGNAVAREQNERYLKELTWLDIPLTYRGDVPGTLAIEKGAEGERIINEALDRWRR
jgi:hypothetical protein